MTKLVTFLVIITASTALGLKSSKRLVLDGDEDLVGAIQTLQATVKQLEAKVTSLESSQPKSGSTYVRWGKMSCPGNGSDLVYKGYMAGNKWDQTGGGANDLCLPEDPNWAKYMDSTASGSTIHGTEIEGNAQLLTLLFGSNVHDQDLSCAVCKTPRSVQVMIPGRSTCYAGWNLEYQGYVVTSGESWAGSNEYVCLDANLDTVPHGSGNDNEHVVDVVEAQCGTNGGLSCPPYVQGRELACVVCSQ